MPANYEWTGFASLQAKLAKLADPDMTPLMHEWEDILTEDNRKGVLEGVDMFEAPMPELKYREGRPMPAATRSGASRGSTTGSFKGSASDNLTNSQYRKLKGPRLAPRGEESRIIANYVTGSGRDPSDRYRWMAFGKWLDVVDKDGNSFLDHHFNGLGRNPRYDLRGVREWGRNQALAALKRFANLLAKG